MTTLTIRAVYEEGKLRPLQPLPLQEHECVLLHVTREESVQETSGLVDGLTPDIIREVAEGEEYSVLCA
jgi:predicted DNA-binding antitoxin AbrB/MazE fold protein